MPSQARTTFVPLTIAAVLSSVLLLGATLVHANESSTGKVTEIDQAGAVAAHKSPAVLSYADPERTGL